jgi:hypothetical protein
MPACTVVHVCLGVDFMNSSSLFALLNSSHTGDEGP